MEVRVHGSVVGNPLVAVGDVVQPVGVGDAVAPSQRRRNQGHHLVARVRPPRRISEVNVAVDELTQTQVLGEGHRKEQPGIGHQTVIVEGDLNPVGVFAW